MHSFCCFCSWSLMFKKKKRHMNSSLSIFIRGAWLTIRLDTNLEHMKVAQIWFEKIRFAFTLLRSNQVCVTFTPKIWWAILVLCCGSNLIWNDCSEMKTQLWNVYVSEMKSPLCTATQTELLKITISSGCRSGENDKMVQFFKKIFYFYFYSKNCFSSSTE